MPNNWYFCSDNRHYSVCKVRKIHLLAINGLMWTAIGTKISITGISHYLITPTEKLWWMIPLSVLVFAGFYMMFTGITLKYLPGIPESFFAWFYLGLGPGLLSAGIRFLIRWWKAK